MVSAVSLGCNAGAEWLLVRARVQYIMARLIASLVVGIGWNFPMHRHFVFRAGARRRRAALSDGRAARPSEAPPRAADARARAPRSSPCRSATSTSPAGWTTYATRDGITLERRRPEGARFYEHRAVVDVDGIAPARAADEIGARCAAATWTPQAARILSERPTSSSSTIRIRTPVVSDRDYTIVVRRRAVGARVWFECRTANDRGPPPAPGYVRIPVIVAGWYVEPDGRGGTRLGYFAYSEPGGSVPAFLVRGAQADRSLADVVRMVDRLRARR